MNKAVRFSEVAEQELEAIGDWIAVDNPNRAVTFVEELAASCRQLGNLSERFARVEGYPNIRKRVHGNYIIFYRVGSDVIDILHIYHGSMDIDEADFFGPTGSDA